MLKTFVKINHVNNLSVARYCAGMFVDVIGFSVDPDSDFYVPFEKYKEMVGWLSGLKICIETNSKDVVFVQSMIDIYTPDIVEISEESLLNEDLKIEMIFKGKSRLAETSHHDDISILEKNDILEVNDQSFKLLDLDNLPKISINAPKEERPGFQDFGQLMDILEALDVD